jgi:hypothetical protein
MKKLIMIGALLAIVIGGTVAWYVFRPMPSSVAGERTELTITDIPSFIGEFESDEDDAHARYGNKVIEIEGIIENLDLDQRSITLTGTGIGGVICSFHATYTIPEVSIGNPVRIKGRVAGFLLTDVQLTSCGVLK